MPDPPPAKKELWTTIDLDELCNRMQSLQVPCPWGDLRKGEGITKDCFGIPGFDKIPYIPLGLVVGCGYGYKAGYYESIARTLDFGYILFSDIHNPHTKSGDYIYLDLTDPDNLNVMDMRFHAIMSMGVFTYDSRGVQYTSKEVEKRSAKAICDMLMPGGIIANNNFSMFSGRFERILEREFGFWEVIADYGSVVMQKPFES